MTLLKSEPFKDSMKCPPFSLPSVDDRHYELSDFDHAKGLLVAFICNHCPYVRAIEERLIKLAHDYEKKGIQTVAICSNDAEKYPADSKEELLKRWQEKKYGLPYLIDKDQSVARNFNAVCTPDLFLYDQNRKLFYHGQLDNNWQDEGAVTSHDLRDAIDDMLGGKKPPSNQRHSMGCSIKWK